MEYINTQAPDFTLLDQHGQSHTLSSYTGKRVLLYFYPKDATPGCTQEACSFRDNFSTLTDKNVIVLGVSCDSVDSHKKFAEKQELPFPLLSDNEKVVVKLYDVWKEKSMFGKKYMGIQRDSFLIDENGIIIQHYIKVKPAKHVAQILKDLG
ncbi:MAG: thioredoxin-dependent thiol peroxidase [Candidatus Magasanikbacteria bacterium]|nr:thioredoxin-dependent thiol peroxidase [Candidatus Magasanikbacteria bacterium]|tara:strand:- start:1332 stop:1787 length:456 start_codon:yes stop_codon:yes gene_type:complete